jgi:hypothetical protein
MNSLIREIDFSRRSRSVGCHLCVEKRMAFIDIAKSTGKVKYCLQSVERRALKKLRIAIERALHPA